MKIPNEWKECSHNKEEQLVKLNLGCGLDLKEGWVNVDLDKRNGADVVHNLEVFPYPFKDNSVDLILMKDCLEHLQDTIGVMRELHRICKPNAIVEILVPHYSGAGAFGNITHKRFFGSGSMSNLEPDNWERYTEYSFNVLEERLNWFSSRNYLLIRPLKCLIDHIININHFFSERFLRYLFLGFDGIYFKLQVVKEIKLKKEGATHGKDKTPNEKHEKENIK